MGDMHASDAAGCVVVRGSAWSRKRNLLTCCCALQVERLQRADKEFMDRVNMYSSFYVAVRK